MAKKRTGIIRNKTAQGISNPIGPRLLPLKKATHYLGLTLWGLRERIWRGEIPIIQFPGGRKMFIDTKDIEAFIQQNKRVIN